MDDTNTTIDLEKWKECPNCKIYLESRNKYKIGSRLYHQQYIEKNKEKVRLQRKSYYHANKEAMCEKARKNYKKNINSKREYYNKNKVKILEKAKLNYKKKKEKNLVL